jgi:hypothetical protein
MARPYKPSKEDEAVLLELRERYEYAKDKWAPIIAEGRTDMRYIAGQTWDEADKVNRKGRLTLEFDQLGQYLNQVENAWRQNKRSIKVTPKGAGANDQTAMLRGDRIRQIEYESHAQEAYIAGFRGGLERSFGYVRVIDERESPKSFNRALRVRSVPNPEQVLPDPDFRLVAGGDWQYLFYLFPMPRREFQKRWPNAKTSAFMMELKTIAPDWHQQDQVLVAEYWRIVSESKNLVLVGRTEADAQTYYEDELEKAVEDGKILPGSKVFHQETVDVPKVEKRLTNGVEILAGEDGKKVYVWPGPFIPFSACYGKMLYMSEQGISTRVILSFIRLARHAQKYFNWVKSTSAEAVKMPVRAALWAVRGQLTPDEMEEANDSLNSPRLVLTYGAKTEDTGEQILSAPTRPPMNVDLSGYSYEAESAKRDIQAALGRYNASVGKSDSSVHSGLQQKALDAQSDQGSYHFTDAGDAMIEHVGEILDAALDSFDDTAKEAMFRSTDGVTKGIRINDPTAIGPDGKPAHVTMTGEHLVTIGTGPAFDSDRDVVSKFLDGLLGNMEGIARIVGPKVASQLLSLAIKLRNLGPLGEKMAEIISPDQGQQGGDPQQLQQRLMDAEKAMQSLHAALQKAEAGNETKIQIAQMDNATKQQIAQADRDSKAADREVKLAVAELSAKMKDVQLFMEESQLVGARAHEVVTDAIQHERDLQLQREQQAHELTVATIPPPAQEPAPEGPAATS